MSRLNRRQFGMLAGAGMAGLSMPKRLFAAGRKNKPKIVIVGGGQGGMAALATLSKYIRSGELIMIDPARYPAYLPLARYKFLGADSAELFGTGQHFRSGLSGYTYIRAWVASVDRAHKTLNLSTGKKVGWDFLVLAPGADFRFDSYPGYDLQTQFSMPHGWSNVNQTCLLRKRIEEVPQGGALLMVLASGLNSMRAAMLHRIAEIDRYFTRHNPNALLLVMEGDKHAQWFASLEDHIRHIGLRRVKWIPFDQHGGIEEICGQNIEIRTVRQVFQPDAASIMPRQKSADIMHIAGLTLGDWVPISTRTMASVFDDRLFVIGDALGSAADQLPLNIQVKRVLNAVRQQIV